MNRDRPVVSSMGEVSVISGCVSLGTINQYKIITLIFHTLDLVHQQLKEFQVKRQLLRDECYHF